MCRACERAAEGLLLRDLFRRAVRCVLEVVRDLEGELAARGQQFDTVITVCSKAAGLCPFVPGVSVTERWSFDDPGAVSGPPEEQLAKVRAVRDAIEAAVRVWIAGRPA